MVLEMIPDSLNTLAAKNYDTLAKESHLTSQ